MTRKIVAIAASNSRKSINRSLVQYAGKLLENCDVEYLDLNDYEMPIYSEDIEAHSGIPEAAKRFLEKIRDADALLISYAEHNGGYTVAYKNIFDWASRHNREVYQGKSLVMLSTSPGPGGAQSVLNTAVNSAHFFAGEVVGSFSLPSFYDNFDRDNGELLDVNLRENLKKAVANLHG